MQTAIIIIHVAACFAVILVVLLSKGKGADLGAAFGGSSQTVFGSQGAGGMLTKLVAICVGVFMMTSLGLAHMSSSRRESTVMTEGVTANAEAPSAPAAEEPAAEAGKAPATQEAGPGSDAGAAGKADAASGPVGTPESAGSAGAAGADAGK
jgi:preprotein translocase subunit SecG